MAKRLRREELYLAPGIRGKINSNGNAEVYDEIEDEILKPDSIDDKLKIYQRQVEKWFLERATRLLQGPNNGFVILMIAVSYIEGVQQYINGQSSDRNSKEFFKQGVKRIFSLSSVDDRNLNEFYNQVRCGLFHNGMSGGNVIISYEFEQPIDFSEPQAIKINPQKFLYEIKKDFSKYLSILKNVRNTEERNKFDSMFSVR